MNTHSRQRAPRNLTRRARKQRGMAAIEFALVFPLFFVILYAIVTYSLILVAQQNLTLAASEGARAALNWQSNSSMSDALTRRASAACDAAKLVAATLVQSMHCTTTTTSCGPGNAMQCISVSLSFDYSANPLVPTLPGFGLALPNKLFGNATVQLNPENIQ